MRQMEHTIGSRMAGLMRLACLLLLSAMSAVVLLSCGGSGDEPAPDPVPQPEGTPIAFSGSLSEGQSENHARTRATTSPLSSTHQTFHVWAYKNPATGSTETVMKNYTVNYVTGTAGTTTSNSSGWEYVNLLDAAGVVQGIKYWDFTASDYRFFGYAGTGVTPTYSLSSDPPEVSLAFEVNATAADLSDLTDATLFSKLWYKTGTAIASDIKPVQLEFLQPCVKVRFLFKQSASPDVYFYKKDIEFKPTDDSKKIVTGGKFTVTYPLAVNTTKESWSVETGAGITSSATIDALTQVDDAPSPAVPVLDDGVWYQVLPVLNQGSYTLSVTINNEPREVVVPGEYMNWQPGFEYTYIFKITDSGGVTFDGLEVVKIIPWTPYDEEREVYNW